MNPAAAGIAGEIRRAGPISFARFMELALYGDGGYYRTVRTGKAGDFITSVTVGSCFGDLLAEQVFLSWQRLGAPAGFDLIEQGAGDGVLMGDVLRALHQRHPDCLAAASIHLVEPLAEMAVQQRQTLAGSSRPAIWHHGWSSVRSNLAIFFCNELLDAFPVHRLLRQNAAWVELAVTLDSEGAFSWCKRPISCPHVQELAQRLPTLPDGYRTEVCPGIGTWLQGLSAAIRSGHLFIVDYGLPGSEYYAAERPDGTLRGYRNHRQAAAVLTAVGETDLTTHVNWTQVAEMAAVLGWQAALPVSQGKFLTTLAAPRLRAMPARPPAPATAQWLRQFQTLTHPAHLGQRFQVLHLSRSGAAGDRSS